MQVCNFMYVIDGNFKDAAQAHYWGTKNQGPISKFQIRIRIRISAKVRIRIRTDPKFCMEYPILILILKTWKLAPGRVNAQTVWRRDEMVGV